MKEIHFKKIQWKKPDLKGKWQKLKNMKPGDIKAHLKKQHERRQQILEKRRNSKFAKKMAPYYKIMNRFSLPLQALWACIINFIIEALSRHSAIAAWQYMTGTPLVFLYNAGMIFVTLLIAYLERRRVFTRLIISALWLFLGVVNGVMLAKRVTPFNAQDLKTFTEGLSLFTNYFSVAELVMMGIGVPALLIWLVAMWRRAGQYEGKMHRIPMLIIVVAAFFGYSLLTNVAVDKRIISTYFGNIAFAYQDYGLPYCFSASLFNTGISEPNDYNKDTIEKITDNREMTESTSDNGVRPNVLFVQLESFFDPIEYEDLQMSEDPIPNLRKMFENYSSGYREVLATIHESYEYITPRPNIILQLHRDLYSYSQGNIGGTYKNSDNVIAETDAEGHQKARFIPVPAFQTAEAIDELCARFLEAWEANLIDKLILIPMFILDFLCIHPFNDGNGRMSRLLTLLLFYKAGYIVGKYVSMEMLIEKTKETYYEALQASSVGWHEDENSYEPFVKYYLGIMLKAYNEFESRVEHLKYHNLSKPDRIKAVIDNKVGKITKKEIMELCPDISKVTVERTLTDLVKSGYIAKVGAGPSTGYVRI